MRNPLFANFPLERLITNRNIKNKYKFEVRNNVVIDCYESHQASAQRIMDRKLHNCHMSYYRLKV